MTLPPFLLMKMFKGFNAFNGYFAENTLQLLRFFSFLGDNALFFDIFLASFLFDLSWKGISQGSKKNRRSHNVLDKVTTKGVESSDPFHKQKRRRSPDESLNADKNLARRVTATVSISSLSCGRGRPTFSSSSSCAFVWWKSSQGEDATLYKEQA
ncbi:hypothetical protein ACFE04_023469 [Oxalis oulophora]